VKKNQIGNTSLFVSEIGFGGASIGNLYQACRDEDAKLTVETAWRSGICYFDTAPEYGSGLSERRLGDFLRHHARRDYVLSTKVGDFLYARHDVLPEENKWFINTLPFHLKYDYSYDGVMRSFEDSLQRLGLNKIDMILVHDLDPVVHQPQEFKNHFKTYIDGGYKALHQLRSEGVIDAIGLGVKKWEVCEDAMQYGTYDCFMLQGNYTLLEQPAFDEFMPRCVQQHISILIAGPFASGILATGAKRGAHFHHQQASKEILAKVKKIENLCEQYAVSLQAAAIQFPMKHPAIASVVIGTASPVSIKKNLGFAEEKIPSVFWEALKSEKIIPENAPTD
jgi:D-threo-aldose 1-dehydrogenase